MAEKVGSIFYELTLEDSQFQQAVKGVSSQLENLGNKISQEATRGSYILAGALSAVAVAAGGLIAKTTLTAARTETLGVAMKSIAKATGTSMEELKKQEEVMKSQGIATQEARAILALFMQSQLDVADASKISRVAQDLAVIAGQNSSETAATLTQAIANESVMMLRQFGIVTTTEKIMSKYAETLGKTAEELTETERKQAFLNTIMIAGEKVTGTYEAAMETAGKKLGSLDRHFQEASTAIGTVFLPAFGALIDALTEFLKLVTTENVEKFLSTVVEYLPIISGAIIGGLVPALVALGRAIMINFVGPLIMLIPYIAVGALIGAAIWALIKIFQHWGDIMKVVAGVISGVKDFIVGVFTGLWSVITNVVSNIANAIYTLSAPFRWLYYNLIEPILLLINAIFLRVFYDIFVFLRTILTLSLSFIKDNFLNPVKNFFTSIFNSIASFVQSVWNKIYGFIATPVNNVRNVIVSTLSSVWSFITSIFNNIVSFLYNIGSRIVDALTSPFRRAKEFIEDSANKIREAANKINPFYRQSPSLVENVIKGLDIIKKEYASLGNIVMPSASGLAVDEQGRTRPVEINMGDVNIRNQSDIEALGRELGFRANL